jgi:plasmid stabilization system protein ParE
MEYRVILTDSAIADIEGIFGVVRAVPVGGYAWANEMLDALNSLGTFPKRYPLAREAEATGRSIRCMLFGRKHGIYRSLYEVEEIPKRVWILHVRHGARADLEPDQIARAGWS